MKDKIFTGQQIHRRNSKGDEIVICPRCLDEMTMRGSAWFDTKDGLYRHYRCLSKQRLAEIKNKIKEQLSKI